MENQDKYLRFTKQTVDCCKFYDRADLDELLFHDCHIENLSAVTKMPMLKRIIFARCTFGGGNLEALRGVPALAGISVNEMSAEGLEELYKLNKLKRIWIRSVTGFEMESLAAFTNLYTLDINDMGLHNGAFIEKLVNLRRLNLHGHIMDNLDFLEMLPMLHKFFLKKPAKDEKGLQAVSGLSNLKEFIYPVKDVSIYRNCLKLEEIGMSPEVIKDFSKFEVFAGSKVRSFTVCGKIAQNNLAKIALEMKKYVSIYSYGASTGT